MSARANILSRLRDGQSRWGSPRALSSESSKIFSDLRCANELAEQFSENVRSLKGEVFHVPDEAKARAVVEKLIGKTPLGAVRAVQTPLLKSIFADSFGLAGMLASAQQTFDWDNATYGEVRIGITGCDALVARTGSIVLRSPTAGGRRLSVLPEFHIVVAHVEQLIPALDSSIHELREANDWSYGVVITGPSRTADIEKILVLGAHGPKRLGVVLVG